MPKKTRKPSDRELRDLDIEISFLEGIVRRDPEYVDALQLLGDDYTRRGRFAEGLKVDETLVRLCPKSDMAHYNLACSLSLLDNVSQSASILLKAINLGYRDFEWMAHDPDLNNLRTSQEYDSIRAKLRDLNTEIK
jgi:hypothetical protein